MDLHKGLAGTPQFIAMRLFMNSPEFKNPEAPWARQTIVHRFIGGCRWRVETSPVRDGRKWFSNPLSSLTGLIAFGNISPSVETLGYGLPAFGLFRRNPVKCFVNIENWICRIIGKNTAPLARQIIAHRFNGGLTKPQTKQVP